MTPAYRRYLKSESWHRIRDAILVQAEFRCEAMINGARCLNDATQVHHVRYVAELGTETPDMCLAVCRHCHMRFHRLVDRIANDNQLALPFEKTGQHG